MIRRLWQRIVNCIIQDDPYEDATDNEPGRDLWEET